MTATVTQIGTRKIDYALAAQMLRDCQTAAAPGSVGMALLKEAERLCAREHEVQFLLAMIAADDTKYCGQSIVDGAKRVREFRR